ncbi:glycosyltransferase [bacterium]|nr:glycosyltransferase [bacterium]
MEKKVISIVTPTFNEGELIIKCCSEVARIFAKNLDDYILEHIVCDNGSDYESYNIVRSLPDKFPHVKVIVNTRNFGVLPNAYNGAMSASGDAILLFLPVDLQDPPHAHSKVCRALE